MHREGASRRDEPHPVDELGEAQPRPVQGHREHVDLDGPSAAANPVDVTDGSGTDATGDDGTAEGDGSNGTDPADRTPVGVG